jgi:signal transduction histidine kinase
MITPIRLATDESSASSAYDRGVDPRPPLTKRLSRTEWMLLDVLFSVAMLGVFVAYVAFGHRHHHFAHPAVLYGLAVPASLPLALRRRAPLPVLAVVLAASVTFGILASATSTVTGATYALYTVAVQVGRPKSLIALTAVVGGVIMSFALITSATSNPYNAAFTALVQVTVWLVGDGVRRHGAYAAGLREQSVRQALAEQRLQIARDLHDVVAHAMSVVAVQAGVGGHVIATKPEEAARALRAIEVTARSALTETRYLLGLLRDQDGAASEPLSSPGIASLQSLADGVTATGLPVTLRVDGEPRPLSPSIELSAYRIVQEALTNVVKHARDPGGAEVVVRYGDDGSLEVEITDDGRGAAARGTGHGLTGMRERVGIFGGEFRAGPGPEGGFRVAARLPTEAMR